MVAMKSITMAGNSQKDKSALTRIMNGMCYSALATTGTQTFGLPESSALKALKNGKKLSLPLLRFWIIPDRMH